MTTKGINPKGKQTIMNSEIKRNREPIKTITIQESLSMADPTCGICRGKGTYLKTLPGKKEPETNLCYCVEKAAFKKGVKIV